MLKKIANFAIDGAIILMGTALSLLGVVFVGNDVNVIRASKALPAPQPEAPVEEAQNAEEPAAE